MGKLALDLGRQDFTSASCRVPLALLDLEVAPKGWCFGSIIERAVMMVLARIPPNDLVTATWWSSGYTHGEVVIVSASWFHRAADQEG